ncbi:MAG: glucose-1-phosphate adenylyltransferase [Parachlamydiaceae bacterium]|nr:glucose-1-phosphate adenylyltransferase [Parachlamydiaceae bacterium]
MGLAVLTPRASGKTIPKKNQKDVSPPDMNRVASIILGGGEGTRLFPLTLNCCKPAINFGGRFKLIDIPIANSINSGCNKIFVITQFLSASLHQHLFRAYRNDTSNSGFLEILSAELKHSKMGWFKGTADAVRQNIEYLLDLPVDYFLILSGDQLYTMDFREMVQTAKDTDADLIVAALPVKGPECKRMGILKIDSKRNITDFIEKPQDLNDIEHMRINIGFKKSKQKPQDDPQYLGSMGIYLFKREALIKLLHEDSREDFGKHLLPTMVERGKAAAHIFNGYWEDIGTIESFYHANIAMTSTVPPLDCYNEQKPIISTHHNLMGPKLTNTLVNGSIICEGCRIDADEIRNSILGPRTTVGKGSVITESYLMGNDYYISPVATEAAPKHLQIGKNCIIMKSIIDKNVCIGDNVCLINKNGLTHYDDSNIYIRDGIIVVPRGATIPDGFIL